MTESNLPAEGTATDAPLSFDDGVDAITSLISDPETDLGDEVEAKNKAEDEADEAEQAEGAEDEATDEQQEDEQEQDGPDEVGTGGKFVSNDAKVTLSDGTVTTVEALKRGFMSQQSFTRSTQEVAEKRKSLEAKESQVGQVAQALAQQRDFILQAAQAFLPKAPDKTMMADDPFGYMQAKADYDERMQVVNQLLYQKQAESGRMTEEQKAAQAQHRATEAEKLFEAVPEFRDRKVYDQFWNDAVEIMAEFGYTPDELQEADDHRQYRVMRELVKYRKAQKIVPKVKQELAAKPKIMAGGKRMDPKAKTSRESEARREQFRKTGDFDTGVALLKSLNL